MQSSLHTRNKNEEILCLFLYNNELATLHFENIAMCIHVAINWEPWICLFLYFIIILMHLFFEFFYVIIILVVFLI